MLPQQSLNSNALEQMLDKVPGVTPVFMHMNADYWFLKEVHPWHLFLPDGGVQLFLGPTLINWNTSSMGPALSKQYWRAAIAKTYEVAEEV